MGMFLMAPLPIFDQAGVGPGLWSWWTVQNDVVGIFVLLDLDDQLPVVGRGVGNEVASLACLLPNGKPARRGALVLLPKRI